MELAISQAADELGNLVVPWTAPASAGRAAHAVPEERKPPLYCAVNCKQHVDSHTQHTQAAAALLLLA